MPGTAFGLGAADRLMKLASLDATVHNVVSTAIRAHLPAGQDPGLDEELEELLPDDGDLEATVATLEENFDVTLPSDTVFDLFSGGTVSDLEGALVSQLTAKTPSKTAAFDSHAYYMRHRARRQQQSRQYRMRNLHQIRRKSKIYRAKVKRRQVRPRRRVGSSGGGYTFIPR